MRIDVERRTSSDLTLVAAVGVLALSAAVFFIQAARAQSQAGVVGRWTTLSTTMPINPGPCRPAHETARCSIVSGSGNVATETNFRAAVWNPPGQHYRRAQPLAGTCSATGWSRCPTAAY